MFQPKKTIPKLAIGALALTGCGDPGVAGPGSQRQCPSEKTVAGYGDLYGDYYGGEGFEYSDLDGCANGGSYYGGYYGGGSGDGVVLPDNDPNPTNDPFLAGGDSFYNGY
ncbi:MAG: hypothetical protein OES69_08580 [Myxococcales bacterium]|nr:hypothetical protein [Myxococcales bacterium]MDH3843980.1 hypothetical protein [Myxococcales bacterium]